MATVTVVGAATLRVVPDTATMSLSVDAVAATASEALDATTDRAHRDRGRAR